MIRYATIGTNFIVDRFVAAAQTHGELHYAAVYSRNADTAAAFAARYHADRICTNLEKLAAADDIDGVYIASPNSFHYEQAALLLAHKKHILCEKTITSNTAELKHLITLAEFHQTVLLEAMRSVFTPGYQAITENLFKLGTIRRASFNYCQYSSRYDNFKKGIIENAFNLTFSTGALMDIGVYCVHPLVRMFGLPKELKTDALLLHNGIDGAGTILAGYDTMQAELVYSKITDNRLPSQIQGEQGTMLIDSIDNPHEIVFIDRSGKKKVLFTADRTPDMSGEITAWINLIHEGSRNNIHNHYSLMALSLMDQARQQMGIHFPADSRKIRSEQA